MLVGHLRQRGDVGHVSRRISDRFAIDGTRAGVDGTLDIGRLITVRKLDGHSLPRQEMREHGVRRPIELRHGNYIAARLDKVAYRIEDRSLPCADAQRLDAAFQGSNTMLQHRVRRVADTAVTMSLRLQIEQRSGMLGAFKSKRDGLVYRDCNRPGCGVTVEARMQRKRRALHHT